MQNGFLIDREGNEYRQMKSTDEIIATVPIINKNFKMSNIWIVGGDPPPRKRSECQYHGNNCSTCWNCAKCSKQEVEDMKIWSWYPKHNIGLGSLWKTI
eukprot:TRINITY_DN16882_c0_g1_i1.p1 TRINITY_DN16882_c0_g1~~TRINITY_DN16882_c0_g1_i1.p1  ORF type:complete len:109 (+),score=6.62 TRINITY_DN16882_c0_g1_i1:32-328(+)